jgi:hypothetical protein
MITLPIRPFFIIWTILAAIQLTIALPQPHFSDGSLQRRILERRDVERRSLSAKPCSLLDLDDTQSLPGWEKLEKYARATWGDGDWTVTINPPGYKDKPATMCVADKVPIVMAGNTTCVEKRMAIAPVSPKSDHVKVDEGYTNVGNWNITNVTTAAHAEFFRAVFQLPNITSVQLDSVTTSGEFINAPSNSFITLYSNKTIKDTEITPVPDQTCIATILNQQCITPAEGSIQLVASGYIWFTYKEKRAPVANPKGGKHFKYAVKIEDVLTNVLDRSAWIDFRGYMNSTFRYDSFDECRWNFKL